MNTLAIRERRRINNKMITLNFPDDFQYDEVDIIILPIPKKNNKTNFSKQSIKSLKGKIKWTGNLSKLRESRI